MKHCYRIFKKIPFAVSLIQTKNLCKSVFPRILNNDLVIKIDENIERFPLVWLRDNCRCENCFHPGSQSRMINWNYFKLDRKAKSVEADDNNIISIKWDDDHNSQFSLNWLIERSFSKENQERVLQERYRASKVLWDENQFHDITKKYEYNDVMTNDNTLLKWLRDLVQYGIVFMKNAPIDENEAPKIARKIAFIRKTHYGEEFLITAKPGTSNVAYLSNLLQLHTDLPYYEYAPGVTILYYIEQTLSKGGENLLTDAFFVAEKLRKENKEAFNILSSVHVNWLDIGEEDGIKYHKIFRSPMICLDWNGTIQTIRHSVPQRDSYFTVDRKWVQPWYGALKEFVNMINIHAAKFKVEPGEVLAFDNLRLTHGRLQYEDKEQNRRLLVGLYLDWDEIYSKIRVLQKNSLQ